MAVNAVKTFIFPDFKNRTGGKQDTSCEITDVEEGVLIGKISTENLANEITAMFEGLTSPLERFTTKNDMRERAMLIIELGRKILFLNNKEVVEKAENIITLAMDVIQTCDKTNLSRGEMPEAITRLESARKQILEIKELPL